MMHTSEFYRVVLIEKVSEMFYEQKMEKTHKLMKLAIFVKLVFCLANLLKPLVFQNFNEPLVC